MFRFFVVTLAVALSVNSYGQKRPVSVIHNNSLFNYAITRYVPAWEIQKGQNRSDGLLSNHPQFFKQVTANGLESFKGLIYSKALVPDNVKSMSAADMEAHLASNKLVIHYRIQFKNHSIFIAHINDSPVRSVIPFLIDGGRWILDPSFADTDFYQLISSKDFDPYMGLPGEVIASYAFEDVSKTAHYFDYSGRGNNGALRTAHIVDGRFGGALRLNGNVAGSVSINNTGGLQKNFAMDFHLQVAKMVYNTERKREVLTLKGVDGQTLRLEVVGSMLRFSYPTSTGVRKLEWASSPDVWTRISVRFKEGSVVVEVDGVEVGSTTVPSLFVLENSVLQFGSENGVKASMDEFRITR